MSMSGKGANLKPANDGVSFLSQSSIMSFFGKGVAPSSPKPTGQAKNASTTGTTLEARGEDKTAIQQPAKRRKKVSSKAIDDIHQERAGLIENRECCDVDDAGPADTVVQRKRSSHKAGEKISRGEAASSSHRNRKRAGQGSTEEGSSTVAAVEGDTTATPETTTIGADKKGGVLPLGGGRRGTRTAGTRRAACAVVEEGAVDVTSPKTDSEEASPGVPLQHNLERRQGTFLACREGGGDRGGSTGHGRKFEEGVVLWGRDGKGLTGEPGRPVRREAVGTAGREGVSGKHAEKEDVENERGVATAPENTASYGAPVLQTGSNTSSKIPPQRVERHQDDTAVVDENRAEEKSGLWGNTPDSKEGGDAGRRRGTAVVAGLPCRERRPRGGGVYGEFEGIRVMTERGQRKNPVEERREGVSDSVAGEGEASDDGTDEEYVDEEDGDDCRDDGKEGNQRSGRVCSDNDEDIGEQRGEGESSPDAVEVDSGREKTVKSVAVPEAGTKEETQGDGDIISEYELQRLERIKANQAFMASLGLATAKPMAAAATARGSGSKGDKKRSRPVSRPREHVPQAPVRRSARARGDKAVNYSEDHQAIAAVNRPTSVAAPRAPDPEPVLEEIDFDDSTVLRYLCRDAGGGARGANAEGSYSGARGPAAPEGARVVGLRVLAPDRPLSASGLSTIYSMHFCGWGDVDEARGSGAAPALLVAGGKGGIVALFSAEIPKTLEGDEEAEDEDGEEDERTLMNFKAHKGWVSAVRFVDGGGGGGEGMGGCRLLSSANDSVVKLWDTSKQHRGLPRQLCSAEDLHPTRKGIFSMDCYGKRVATGSKDTTVALASLRPTGLAFDRVLGDAGGSEAFHKKVIKGVSLRDEITVASCGDDSNVRVSDLRCAGPSYRLDGVHDGACHTVRWHPRDVNLLLSAGLDSTMKLHDLRKLDAPLHVFRGHCPYALARPRAIHRPEFLPSGAERFNVVTCGERSDKLSMYDSVTGGTVSRGVLGAEATALAVGRGNWPIASAGEAIIAAAKPGGSVALLATVWGE